MTSDFDDTEEVEVSMTSFYRVQQVLMNSLAYTPRKERYAALEIIINDFKPREVPSKVWKGLFQNEIIASWVDNDHVFRRLDTPYVPLTPEQREIKAYYAGLDYATVNGLWDDHYRSLLEELKEEEE